METKTFIYTLQLLPKFTEENNWTEETKSIVSQHFHHLQGLKNKGQVILAGKTDYSVENPKNFGVVIFYEESLESAEVFMNSDYRKCDVC